MLAHWQILQPDLSSLKNLNVPSVIKSILINRGISEPNYANEFLNPRFENLHDPFLIYDMERAVSRILSAVRNKEAIFIYGDYDVDGVCAASILWEFLYKELGANVLPHIPHRIDEGYGLNKESVGKLIQKGANLIITVDCGIRDKEIVDKFSDEVDFIITDHHEIGRREAAPNTIVIHPRHPDGKYPFGEISGAALAWKIVMAIRIKLGMTAEEDLKEGLDLAAFSTICDVMPLVDENRILVRTGLDQIRRSKRIGLNKMIQEAMIKKSEIDAYHLAFILGPRINAAGRLDHALDAVKLLVSPSDSQSIQLARKLGNLNKKRQDITLEILRQAEMQISETQLDQKLFFIYGENWPEGIVGLVAGKLTERHHKPVLVASVNGETAVGSARSILEFNIIESIEKFSSKLIRFGGHAQAAGFTVAKEKLDDFRDSLQALANKVIDEEDLIGKIHIDAELEFNLLDFDLLNWLEKLKPFGHGNHAPIFLTRNVTVASIRAIGKQYQHLKMILFKDEKEVEAIGFGMGELVDEIEVGSNIDIVYNLEINEWNGKKTIQIKAKAVG